MKVSTFYIADISEYDNFIEKLSNDIQKNFAGKGDNSLLVSRLISYLRKEFSNYASYILNTKVNVIINIPRISTRFIERENTSKTAQIIIRLDYNKVKSILNGSCNDLEDYLVELVSQFNDYVGEQKPKKFNNYLIAELDNLVDLCYFELISEGEDFIKDNILTADGWRKLSRKSTIFKDYYKMFLKEKNKKLFHGFLYKLALKLKEK